MYNKILTKIDRLAQRINAPKHLLPDCRMNDLAYPYIEIDIDGNYNYVVRERGEECERKVFNDDQELMFEVFKYIAHSMATEFELKNRIESQDFRIILFSKQEELLAQLDKDWAKRQRVVNKKYLEA